VQFLTFVEWNLRCGGRSRFCRWRRVFAGRWELPSPEFPAHKRRSGVGVGVGVVIPSVDTTATVTAIATASCRCHARTATHTRLQEQHKCNCSVMNACWLRSLRLDSRRMILYTDYRKSIVTGPECRNRGTIRRGKRAECRNRGTIRRGKRVSAVSEGSQWLSVDAGES
jgi:hypothetical protein